MRVRAEFPFVDKTANVVVEMSDEDEQERSDYVAWEYPLCETRLVRGAQRVDVGYLSLMELLGFLHLPLRRNEWPQLHPVELGRCFLGLRVGSFTPDDGSELHQMQLRHEDGDFEIAFSEEQAEQWAVSIWEIKKRLKVFLQDW
ncbi:MAG: hypothetical protein K2P58_12350 [Hyphomonadaceae bacterium]|nr:hypothetical protein [Hyphomonadaceae bacterium]